MLGLAVVVGLVCVAMCDSIEAKDRAKGDAGAVATRAVHEPPCKVGGGVWRRVECRCLNGPAEGVKSCHFSEDCMDGLIPGDSLARKLACRDAETRLTAD